MLSHFHQLQQLYCFVLFKLELRLQVQCGACAVFFEGLGPSCHNECSVDGQVVLRVGEACCKSMGAACCYLMLPKVQLQQLEACQCMCCSQMCAPLLVS